MFTRIRETYRIISYRDDTPVHLKPDIEFVKHEDAVHSKVSKFLGNAIAGLIFVAVAGWIGSAVSGPIHRWINPASVTVAASVAGAILFWLSQNIWHFFQETAMKHLKMPELLTPHVGHKLESTFRILRGRTQ